MAGTRRGPRPPRAAGPRRDDSSNAGPATRARTSKGTPKAGSSKSAPGDREFEETEPDVNTLMSTPQFGGASTTPFRTADLSRPVTRSTKKGYFDSILVESSGTPSQAQERLRVAIARSSVTAASGSRLEEAEDIHYDPTERDIEEDNDREGLGTIEDQNPATEFHNNELENGHPTVGGLRVPRRSDRLLAKNRAAREPSPSTALTIAPVNNNRVQKRRKRTLNTSLARGPPRRSARLAKPLDKFFFYPNLPSELKLMIWEAAVQPRLTYICNRASLLDHANSFGIQNQLPTWFMTCRISAYVAQRYYKKMFGPSGVLGQIPATVHSEPGHNTLHAQDINPDVDIVVYEPCHSGCRACYCAQQYRREDRAAVQKLAVQIDSPHLPLMADLGWVTVSRSWPNLTTLYMMKPAIKGLDRSDKAMIRIKEGDHESDLRKLFEVWKSNAGKDCKLTTLEFVRVVPREAHTKDPKDRYQMIEDRQTGLVDDIILG
ncbi:hypothetical protein F4861DRAFT_231128 [Xylaria intraflava]|nr:hypothetical protein F4861DRAFT_231128 [Xylaria intraflava]